MQRAHDDYLARLRPEVLHEASSSLVQAENALGLFTVLVGGRRSDVGPVRRDTASDQSEDYPLLRWSFAQAPDIDNGPLLIRDRTYRDQLGRAQQLRQRLEVAFTAEREGVAQRSASADASAESGADRWAGPEGRPVS